VILALHIYYFEAAKRFDYELHRTNCWTRGIIMDKEGRDIVNPSPPPSHRGQVRAAMEN